MAMASSSRSTNVAELQRMFSNLDSNVIASVLAANNGQVDLTIDHLLTMSIDTENANNLQQSIPITPLRQLPSIPNIYDDDPPPYPGHEPSNHHRTSMPSLPRRSPNRSQSSSNYSSSNTSHDTSDTTAQRDIQVQRWKTPYGQYRVFYTGDLPDDFLRVKLSSSANENSQSQKSSHYENKHSGSQYLEDEHLALLLQNEEFLNELRHNKEFLSTLRADQPSRPTATTPTQRKPYSHLSTKPLPLPTPPTIETPKTPKVRAKMLQNVLSQIEQGQTLKTSMVPEESITQREGYSYGKDDRERMPLPPAPLVSEFDPLRLESNEEFISRLKHMGKNSMEKFNQLARKFSMRKSSTSNTGRSSRQSMMMNPNHHQQFTNELENEGEGGLLNKNNSMYPDSSWNTIK